MDDQTFDEIWKGDSNIKLKRTKEFLPSTCDDVFYSMREKARAARNLKPTVSTTDKAWLVGIADDLVIIKRKVSYNNSRWPQFNYIGLLLGVNTLTITREWYKIDTINTELDSFIRFDYAVPITALTYNNIIRALPEFMR